MKNPDRLRDEVSRVYSEAVSTPRGHQAASRLQKGVLAQYASYSDEEVAGLPADAVVNSFGYGNPLAFAGISEREGRTEAFRQAVHVHEHDLASARIQRIGGVAVNEPHAAICDQQVEILGIQMVQHVFRRLAQQALLAHLAYLVETLVIADDADRSRVA